MDYTPHTVGAWLITPGMTQTEIDTTDAAIMALVRDVGDSPKADDRFRKEFGEFARNWLAFKERNKGWFSRGTSGVYEQVQEYKKQLAQWRNKFMGLGGKVTAPKLPEKKEILNWKTVVIFGAGAAFVGWLVIRR